MVVCQLVRIRNASRRTFFIEHTTEIYYTPKVGGEICSTDILTIMPGYDQPCEDFVIPWAALASSGLVIWEASHPDEKIRCVVGPCDIDNGGLDWLRLHSEDWEPLAKEAWFPLGARHILGAIGQTEELILTFQEPSMPSVPTISTTASGATAQNGNSSSSSNGRRKSSTDSAAALSSFWSSRNPSDSALRAQLWQPNANSKPDDDNDQQGTRASWLVSLAKCLSFDREVACAPVNTVFLNVYDLASAASIPNALLCNSLVKTFGAFHVAIEVYGDEWGFYRQVDPEECGICRSRVPRKHPVHVYRQSVNLGVTPLQDWQIWDLIRMQLVAEWPGGRYDLIHCNCIHFADEFARLLEVQPVPPWITGLHQLGARTASMLKIPWPSFFNGFVASQEAVPAPALTAPEPDGAEGADEFHDAGSRPPSMESPPSAMRPSFLPAPLEAREGAAA
mmetsp:Transcript_26406/g.55905  ORF Transcript_26406/g.55905 Transcript_26406/m.55905 type:complete len:450 (-) Transcript_26406:146-1495(-)